MTDSLAVTEPISAVHCLDLFDCGVASLNAWLKRHARKNEGKGASRTSVVADGTRVIGYYCLSAGAVALRYAPRPLTRNMPDPIPVMVLGRLAVDLARQRRGLGRALLRDAVLRTLQAGEIVGVAALLVHALSEEAKRFYLSCSFRESTIQPMTLCLRLADVRAAMAE
jgi:GNAT superfamily N-acetyltransferase